MLDRPWMQPDTFVISPWSRPVHVEPVYRPAFADDEELKQAYGIELAKLDDAFKAAMIVFNEDLPSSLWASLNWIKDPAVIGAKDAYLKSAKALEKPLTKEELSAKILKFADEKHTNGLPLVEAKERLNAYKLYAEVQGYIGKINIDASTNNINNTNNHMQVTLVRATPKDDAPKVIDTLPNTQSEILNVEPSPVSLKLVGGLTR